MSDAVLRARSLYSKQKYGLALDILESNVSNLEMEQFPAEDQFVVYDLLAALHEKLGLWPRARKDAARMIQLQPHDLRGYLRLGKILQQIPGKLSSAVMVYRRALKVLQEPQPTYEEVIRKQLRNCMAKLETEQVEGARTRIDFVAILPHELLLLIFQHLTLRQRVKLTRVSRRWRDTLCSESRFWSLLDFDAQGGEQHTVLPAKTLLSYCKRASHAEEIDIDLQRVLLKDPKLALETLAGSRPHAARLRRLQFNTRAPTAHEPLLKMLRVPAAHQLSRLAVLSIKSDAPDRDIVWALESLPALEVLEVVTTARHRSPSISSLPEVACSSLHTIKLLGQSATIVLTEALAAQLSAIPSLTVIEMHRAVATFWPTLYPAAANGRLRRFGFTAEGLYAKTMIAPLPNFCGQLDSLTLNDLNFSYRMPALLPHSGERWVGGDPRAMASAKYIELKRSSFAEVTLPHLLWHWQCAATLETLVIQSSYFTQFERFPRPGDPAFETFPCLTVLQYTGMHALPEDAFEWMMSACPSLRKVNFDGTAITGPKLVRLIEAGVQVVRCKGIMDVSADTIEWARSRDVLVLY